MRIYCYLVKKHGMDTRYVLSMNTAKLFLSKKAVDMVLQIFDSVKIMQWNY